MEAYMLASFAAVAVALAGDPKGGGLPQLNPEHFAPQLIWLAISFALLFFLLSKVALPRVGGVIEAREQRILRDLKEAEQLKAETERALADYESSLASARSRAGGIAKGIRDKLAAEAESERAKVEKQITSHVADAERQIAEVKAKAMGDVGQIATETAEAIVAQLTGKSVSQDEVRKTVEAIAGR
jgi:F-type H+-transporting ATPase subunit b